MNSVRKERIWTPDYIWLIFRYQLLTKIILSIFIFPIYKYLTVWLIQSTGYENLNSSNVLSFAAHPQSLLAITLSILLVLVVIITDIAAFILMEYTRLSTGSLPNVRRTLLAAFKTTRIYAHPSTILLLLYLLVLSPLTGFGITLSSISGAYLPSFISEVIFSSNLYSIIYCLVFSLFTIIAIFGGFIFFGTTIKQLSPWKAYIDSVRIIRTHPLNVLKQSVIPILLLALIVAFFIIGAMLLAALSELFITDLVIRRGLTIFILLNSYAAITAFTLFLPAYSVQSSTELYKSCIEDGTIAPAQTPPVLPPSTGKSGHATLWIIAMLVVTSTFFGCTAWIATSHFDEIAAPPTAIEIIAHRGGGYLGPENTLAGIRAAIDKGVPWTEIDVQRTKDGDYVLNHDTTFARVAGVDSSPQDLTTQEVKRLTVKPATPTQSADRVPTLNEAIELAKGKIGLLLELKGQSADTKMVDDLAQIIKAHGIESKAVLVSLDYDLLKYAETHYPELLTGHIYFFSVSGDEPGVTDYHLIEESIATMARVTALKDSGKKVFVWTVNSEDSLNELAGLPIDGIITDQPDVIQEALTTNGQKHELERILDFNFFQD